jgi:hypothetical protein
MMEHAATVKKPNILNTPVVDTGDTLILGSNAALRRTATRIHDIDPALCERVVFLVIRGLVERVVLTDKLSVIIGRADLKTGFHPDVDLTPYGARTRGISRAHARLHRHDTQLYVTDLSSDNGTFIAGKQLTPDVPFALRSGDEVTFGCLNVKVLFASSVAAVS